MSDDKTCNKIKQWVTRALKDEDLINCQVDLEGQTEKGDGYSGEIHFVTVNGSTKNGSKKTLSLVLKQSMNNNKFTKEKSISEAYRKEVYIYDVAKKTFQKFLEEKNLNSKIDIMPHCYGTLTSDEIVCLAFENLRKQNFHLWDKAVVMTPKHVKLVLEAYGLWHALSMAMRVQKPEIFQDLTRDNKNVFSDLAIRLKFDESIPKDFNDIKKLVVEKNSDALNHLDFSQKDVTYAFTDMFFEDSCHNVILHGDCWNNNFLFQSSDDKTNPSKVHILDWQCSGLGSPAIDLSHFIFSCADTEKNEPTDLLKIYYNSLSKHLRLLGSDPEEVFPFLKLIEHWKKFSRFGMFLSCFIIKICLLNQEDLPDVQKTTAQGKDISEVFTTSGPYDPEFLRRIKNNLLFYCKSFEQ